ncbi:MAG: hypothetical protein ACOH2T_19305 [Pseudomonas sp.]
MSEELTLLKEQADLMGIKYKGNIGVESLREKVLAALDDEPEKEEVVEKKESKQASIVRTRNELMAEQLALVRIRLANLNPAKADIPGEIITVGNSFIGTVRKFIPFGSEYYENGYHVPKIIYEELKNREFNQIRTVKGANGSSHPVQKWIKEFALEVLEPLSQDDLDRLARTQAAANNLA